MHATKKTVYTALFGNLAIAIFKSIAAAMTMSSSMLAESYHSFSDTLNQLFLLLGLRLSKREEDELHPFGYGREQYFWSFVVAVILFGVAGTLSISEGLHKLANPGPLRDVSWNYAAIAIGFIFDGYALSLAYRQLKKTMIEEKYGGILETIIKSKDPTVLTVFMEDSLAVIGLSIATIGITLTLITKNPIFDALGSLIIGIFLMVFALLLGYEIKKLIIGESVTRRKREYIRQVVESFDEVEKVLSLKTMHLSPETVLVAMELKFSPKMKVKRLTKINDKIEKKVKEILPEAKCYIEAENRKS